MFPTRCKLLTFFVFFTILIASYQLAEALTISNLHVTRPYFNPNQGQSTFINATLSASVNWRIEITNSAGTLVKQKNSTQPEINVSWKWDGLTSNGNPHPEDLYTVLFIAAPGPGQVTGTTWTVIDKTDPTININDPFDEEALTNVRQNGSSEFSILGSISDQFAQQQGQIASWILDWGYTWDPAAWTELKNVTTPATSININEIWKTIYPVLVNNGKATIRVRAYDGAGNFKQKLRKVWVSNFRMSHNLLEFNAQNQQVTISSVIPEPLFLRETIKIYNVSNPAPTTQPIKVLLNNVLRPGSPTAYPDQWNGRDASNVIVPDKGYFYFGEVTEQGTTNTMTWPLPTDPPLDDYGQFIHPTIVGPVDPFNNKPLKIPYDFTGPGAVALVVSTDVWFEGGHWVIPEGCSDWVPPEPRNTCISQWSYGDSQPHTLIWPGVDDSGKLVTNIKGVHVSSSRKAFKRNAVVVYGSMPVIDEIFLDPPFYNPLKGSLSVKVKFNIFVGSNAKVTIAFMNQRCLIDGNPTESCTLSTLVNTSVADPAIYVDFPWTGKSGTIWVSPGLYIVKVTVQDNTTLSEITQKALLTVDYSSFN